MQQLQDWFQYAPVTTVNGVNSLGCGKMPADYDQLNQTGPNTGTVNTRMPSGTQKLPRR
jgi:hypothetical protein